MIAGIQNHNTPSFGNIVNAKFEIIEITTHIVHSMISVEKMEIVCRGVSKQFLQKFKITSSLDYNVLAKALSVIRATLINKKGVEKFNAQVSAGIISLADIYSYGYEVFEDEERFNKWMSKPNHSLGGEAPYDFLDNQYGREEIKNIIGWIDYRVYS